MAAHPKARGDLRGNGSVECGERHAVVIHVDGAFEGRREDLARPAVRPPEDDRNRLERCEDNRPVVGG